jgi:hypothetical protein
LLKLMGIKADVMYRRVHRGPHRTGWGASSQMTAGDDTTCNSVPCPQAHGFL